VEKEYRFAGVSVGYAREYYSLSEWEYHAPHSIRSFSFFYSWLDSWMAKWRDNKTAKIFSC